MTIDWRHLFFDLHGRIPRQTFWLGVVVILIVETVLMLPLYSALDGAVTGPAPLWYRNLSLLIDIVTAWPTVAVLAKRHHDRGQQAWLGYAFVALSLFFAVCDAFGLMQTPGGFTPLSYLIGLPLLGLMIILVVELGVRPGETGPNAFGPDPLRSRS